MTAMQPAHDRSGLEEHVHGTLAEELSTAHESMHALLISVHRRDPESANSALLRLHSLGQRLDCHELNLWCDGAARQYAATDLESLAVLLPSLISVWERTQQALIDRAIGRAPRMGGSP